MHGFETLQEQAPEQTREHANRQKEAGPAGNPSLAVRRYAAARFWPQLCRTAVTPMSAPRCLRSAAMVVSVSAAAANSRPSTLGLFWQAIAPIAAGSAHTMRAHR